VGCIFTSVAVIITREISCINQCGGLGHLLVPPLPPFFQSAGAISEFLFAGSLVIVWKRGVTLLTAGQQKITADPRITLLGYNLQVRDIRYTDQGDYTCQIGDGSHGDLIHTVEILSESNHLK
jgi:hypothetical protein